MESYSEFVSGKADRAAVAGFGPTDLPAALFPWQADIVRWACRLGRAAIFADTGLGKTLMQLAWAEQVARRGGRVLVVAPLAVGTQTVSEAERFGIVGASFTQLPILTRITITNYESLHKFDARDFLGVVLDESSILKSYTGKVRTQIIEMFRATPYRLACTATPSPNDYTELGNHAEFLGVMRRSIMLSRWFVNKSDRANEWRLKNHGRLHFWGWVCSWARCVQFPSDLGDYSDDGYRLPELSIAKVPVDVDLSTDNGGLFRVADVGAMGLHRERRITAQGRAEAAASVVYQDNGPCVVWVDTNYDADAVKAAIPHAVEVSGSMPMEKKIRRLAAFAAGEFDIMLTKPKIAGFGLNWQHCRRMVFVGPSHSYEAFYQAVRRCWRFGQRYPVDVSVCIPTTEQGVWANLTGKRDRDDVMKAEMMDASRHVVARAVPPNPYHPTHHAKVPTWMRR